VSALTWRKQWRKVFAVNFISQVCTYNLFEKLLYHLNFFVEYVLSKENFASVEIWREEDFLFAILKSLIFGAQQWEK
jgi:hypothetical protein